MKNTLYLVKIATTIATFCTLFCLQLSCQNTLIQNSQTFNNAAPFLRIAPDARAASMGDLGLATSPDGNSSYWNPSKLAFTHDSSTVGLGISYVPVLRNLVDDMALTHLSSYIRLNQRSVLGISFSYFSLGTITFTDINGKVIRDFSPYEFAPDITYSRKLNDRLSLGLTTRYIYSDLTGGVSINGNTPSNGTSITGGVSLYYRTDSLKIIHKNAELAFGMNISNVGQKITYTPNSEGNFPSTNLGIGSALTFAPQEKHEVTFALDVNKLLVPTLPIYYPLSADENLVIASGKDPNVGIFSGILNSFSDAPGEVTLNSDATVTVKKGSRFKEELSEISISMGTEYIYNKFLSFRAGYSSQNPDKAYGSFISFGSGVKFLRSVTLDWSYLVATQAQNPTSNTMRFSLRLDLKKRNKTTGEAN